MFLYDLSDVYFLGQILLMRTLVFSITALNLLMDPLLNLSFQNPCPRRLVKVGNLEDMCRIDPVVRAPAHYVVSRDIALVHWDL